MVETNFDNENRIRVMKLATRVIKLAEGRKKYREVNRFRLHANRVKRLSSQKKCVICNETRAIEYAHIIHVSILGMCEKKLQDIADTPHNGLFLCKTHHWCFDNMKLTDDELELIYESNKAFIKEVLLVFANLTFVFEEKFKPTISQRNITNRFNKWADWVAKVFFVPKIK